MKDIFKKIASMVVEVPETPAAPTPNAAPAAWDSEPKVRKTIADLARERPGPNLDEVHVPVAPPPPPPASTGTGDLAAAAAPPVTASGPLFNAEGHVDVQAIYAKASLPSTPFTAEQAYEMIQGLPADLPLVMKKQMVKSMLSAMGKTLGVTPETIVTDAGRKTAALGSFVQGMSTQSEGFISKVENDIRELEAKISQSRASIETAQKRITDLQISCELEATRLNEAAEFFSTGSVTQPLSVEEAPPAT